MKKIMLSALLGILLLAGCTQQEERVSMQGLCFVEENGTVLLIEEEYHEPIVLSNQSGQEELFAGLSCGDRIEVLTDGMIRETYPAQMDAYGCTLLEEGTLEDLPRETLDTLASMDWLPRGDTNF